MPQSVKYGPNFPVSLFIFSENIKDKCKNIEKKKKFASTSKNTHPPPAYVPEILCMTPPAWGNSYLPPITSEGIMYPKFLLQF